MYTPVGIPAHSQTDFWLCSKAIRSSSLYSMSSIQIARSANPMMKESAIAQRQRGDRDFTQTSSETRASQAHGTRARGRPCKDRRPRDAQDRLSAPGGRSPRSKHGAPGSAEAFHGHENALPEDR